MYIQYIMFILVLDSVLTGLYRRNRGIPGSPADLEAVLLVAVATGPDGGGLVGPLT